MLFSDLLCLERNDADLIDIAQLEQLLPLTPNLVIVDWFSDHGRKDDFQEQYSNLNISALRWKKIKVPASEIMECKWHPEFSDWILSVKKRVDRFEQDGWQCIDTRPEVVSFWQSNGTWLTPPIFIENSLLLNRVGYRLVEGHTRIGILSGLVSKGVIPSNSFHEIWFAK